MRKTITKKAASPKKTKAVAQKKSLKTSKTEKSKTPKKLIYPAWSMPKHLKESDHKALKRFYELFTQGKFDVALNFVSSLDTIVREQIPSDVWVKTGGKLTKKGEEELKKVEKENEVNNPQKQDPVKNKKEFSCPYIFKKGKLQVFDGEYFSNNKEIIEAQFHEKNDMDEFIIQYHKTLFGENTIIIDNTKSTNEYFPNVFLLDFNDNEKPRMYVIEVNHSKSNVGLLYARITHFIASLNNKAYQNDFLIELCKVIGANRKLENKLQLMVKENQDISELLSGMLNNKPAVLLVKDNENVVLDLMQSVYTETWGKMVRQILLKKYYCGDDTIYNLNPAYSDIWKNEKSKKEEIAKSTEEDHLNATSETVRNIYNEIKTALLKADSSVEFRTKKIYISVRKNKNLAFLHLRKKISLVVMNPEDDTRKHIKHHEIKSLPDSVQKFWNGPSCTIIIENSANLVEVINLLKKMIAKA